MNNGDSVCKFGWHPLGNRFEGSQARRSGRREPPIRPKDRFAAGDHVAPAPHATAANSDESERFQREARFPSEPSIPPASSPISPKWPDPRASPIWPWNGCQAANFHRLRSGCPLRIRDTPDSSTAPPMLCRTSPARHHPSTTAEKTNSCSPRATRPPSDEGKQKTHRLHPGRSSPYSVAGILCGGVQSPSRLYVRASTDQPAEFE